MEKQNTELKVIAFTDVAQKTISYEDYEAKLAQTPYKNINFLGICIYGPKKIVNKITRNLKMLR